MLLWMLITILAVLTGGIIAYRVSRSRERAELPSAEKPGLLLERTVKDVRPNDVVQHEGRDWLVEGVVTYDEDGHVWRAARLADGAKSSWMLVGLERSPLVTVRFLDESPLVVTGYPPETLETAGVIYKLRQRGTATATFEGDLRGIPTAGAGGSLRCRWWRYQAAGDKMLLVEQWGEIYRVLVGIGVPADNVELLGAT